MKFFKVIFLGLFVLGIGLVIAGIVYGADIENMFEIFNNDDKYSEVQTYEFTESSNMIDVHFDQRYVNLILSDQEFISVNYREKENETWKFEVESGVIVIEQKEHSRSRIFNFNFGWSSRDVLKVDIYLPLDLVYDLKIHTNVGSINLELDQMTVIDALNLSSHTGSIRLENVEVENQFDLKTSTGSLHVKDVKGDYLNATVSTGSINIDDFVLNGLRAKSSTGSVRLNRGTVENEVNASTSTGSVALTSIDAKSYDLSSSTGDVSFKHSDLSTYYYDLSVSTGSVYVLGIKQGKAHYTSSTELQNILLKARTSTGSIRITQI